MTIIKTLTALGLIAGVTAAIPHPEQRARVQVVHLIGYTYDSAEIVAQRGDTVRFVQESAMPHNVEFTDIPAGVVLGDAKVGPYVIAEGDSYDLVIDRRFAPGRYSFHCTPHQSLGMKGTLVVR